MEPFLRFLESEKGRMKRLVILGDLFEFLFGFRASLWGRGSSWTEKTAAFSHYHPVLGKIRELWQQGTGITYFEGNHDFSLRSFFAGQLEMEAEVHAGGYDGVLGGKRAFMAHGDLANPEQWRYGAYRKLLRSPLVYGLMNLAGPGLSRRVARWMDRRSSQKYHAGIAGDPPLAFRAFAHQKFLEGFEIVILAHSHFPEKTEEWIGGKKCQYFNVGDWMIHRSYLRFIPPGDFELSRYDETEPRTSNSEVK